jgi:hypothetical protein
VGSGDGWAAVRVAMVGAGQAVFDVQTLCAGCGARSCRPGARAIPNSEWAFGETRDLTPGFPGKT